MAEAQIAYLESNYQLTITLANEAKLLAQKVLPEVEKPMTWKELIFTKARSLYEKALNNISKVADKIKELFSEAIVKIKPSFKDHSQYWIIGAITLLIIIFGLFLGSRIKIKTVIQPKPHKKHSLRPPPKRKKHNK